MSCPHSSVGDPLRCSQCIGATPRRVTQTGRAILVDGKIARLIETKPQSPYTALPRRKIKR